MGADFVGLGQIRNVCYSGHGQDPSFVVRGRLIFERPGSPRILTFASQELSGVRWVLAGEGVIQSTILFGRPHVIDFPTVVRRILIVERHIGQITIIIDGFIDQQHGMRVLPIAKAWTASAIQGVII